MKFTLNILEKRSGDEEKRWPRYVFGGRMRTSTAALIVAFVLVWWLYDTYRPEQRGQGGTQPTQVVPPGFVPDPNYTWVPRSQVQEPPVITYVPSKPTTTTAQTTTTTTPPPAPPTPAPPPFVLPTLPCIPPFCTPTTIPVTPTQGPPQLPQPGAGPSPAPALPVG